MPGESVVVRGPWTDPVEMTEIQFLEWLLPRIESMVRPPMVITLELDVMLPQDLTTVVDQPPMMGG
jgi:hypothetical protein